MLAVLTGPVRSGKSTLGLHLALASGRTVAVAVGGSADDEEMRRRIERHRAERPDDVEVIEAVGEGWHAAVPEDACLLVDCLGSILGARLWDLVPPGADTSSDSAEEEASRLADDLVEWICAREAHTVVVTNEVGWGVVPGTPVGRLFRDTVGRTNRRLVDAADAAWLVVAGRCLDIKGLSQEVSWPR